MAFHDSLTGLTNRRYLYNKIQELLDRTDGDSLMIAIMFIDLDRFKDVNDNLGHDVGDQLLIAVSKRLKNCLRPSDILARQGGDEFIILLTNASSIDDVAKAAHRITASLNKPFNIQGNELIISCSIGIALSPKDGNDCDTLMKNADKTMYHVKEYGKNGYGFYTHEINRIASQKFNLEKNLKQSIKQNE
jgi:diguanylate cyclase (GGDEF)-like protein